jgi:hypothetical protein
MQFSNGVLLFIEKVGKFGASFSLPFSLMHCKPIMGLENGINKRLLFDYLPCFFLLNLQ